MLKSTAIEYTQEERVVLQVKCEFVIFCGKVFSSGSSFDFSPDQFLGEVLSPQTEELQEKSGSPLLYYASLCIGTARKLQGARVAWDAAYCRILCREHVLRTREHEDNT